MCHLRLVESTALLQTVPTNAFLWERVHHTNTPYQIDATIKHYWSNRDGPWRKAIKPELTSLRCWNYTWIASVGIEPNFLRAALRSALLLIAGSLNSPSAATKIVTTIYSLFNLSDLGAAMIFFLKLFTLIRVSASNLALSSRERLLNRSSAPAAERLTSVWDTEQNNVDMLSFTLKSELKSTAAKQKPN